jgi:2-haloacid dehalogenase
MPKGFTMSNVSRRDVLRAGAMGAAAVHLLPIAGVQPVRGAAAAARASVTPKAIIFDVFGTVVEWRSSIVAEATAWGKAHRIQNVDWTQFATEWRQGQGREMSRVRRGELPWTKLDDLHRMVLDGLLTKYNITGLTEKEKDHWNRVWHRLRPWPDSIPGLTRLKKKYTIAPLSNGNFAMLTNMAKNAGLPWDCILSAELARHFKYDREAYLTAVELLGLKPGDVMMGAAHTNDLKAARSFGLLTGHIDRPIENDKANPGDFDVVAKDMVDFASQLGA